MLWLMDWIEVGLKSLMATEHLAKWFNLASCPISKIFIIVPSGINKDNFIVIEKDICCIHKYNINSNKWTTTDVSETIGDIICDHAALDTHQNVLYFLSESNLVQMELNTNKITKSLLASQTTHDLTSECIILNNELFLIGGESSYSISKWNAKTKQFTQIGNIYNETVL
eukprot:469580_1